MARSRRRGGQAGPSQQGGEPTRGSESSPAVEGASGQAAVPAPEASGGPSTDEAARSAIAVVAVGAPASVPVRAEEVVDEADLPPPSGAAEPDDIEREVGPSPVEESPPPTSDVAEGAAEAEAADVRSWAESPMTGDNMPFVYNTSPRWPTVVLGMLLGAVVMFGGLYALAQFYPNKSLALLGIEIEEKTPVAVVATAPIALEPSHAPPTKAPPAAPVGEPEPAAPPRIEPPPAAPAPPPSPATCVPTGNAFSGQMFNQRYGSGGIPNRWYTECADGRVMLCGPKTRLTGRMPDGSYGINLVDCTTLAREDSDIAGP